MDSRKHIKKEAFLAFKALHQKIDSVKERVEKLCEQTAECFEHRQKDDSKENIGKTKKNKLY